MIKYICAHGADGKGGEDIRECFAASDGVGKVFGAGRRLNGGSGMSRCRGGTDFPVPDAGKSGRQADDDCETKSEKKEPEAGLTRLPAACVMVRINYGSLRRVLLDRHEHRRVLSRQECHLLGHLFLAFYKTDRMCSGRHGKFLDTGFADQFPVEIDIRERGI